MNANLPPEQRPDEIGFFAQTAKPGLAIGGEPQVGLPIMAVGDLQVFVSNRDGCFHFFMAGEREVIDSVETF